MGRHDDDGGNHHQLVGRLILIEPIDLLPGQGIGLKRDRVVTIIIDGDGNRLAWGANLQDDWRNHNAGRLRDRRTADPERQQHRCRKHLSNRLQKDHGV